MIEKDLGGRKKSPQGRVGVFGGTPANRTRRTKSGLDKPTRTRCYTRHRPKADLPAQANGARALVARGLRRVEQFEQSVLARAFRGEV